MTIQDVVAELSGQLETGRVRTALLENLRKQGIMSATAKLGGDAGSQPKSPGEAVRSASPQQFEANPVTGAIESLDDHIVTPYEAQRKKAGMVLWTSLIAAAVMVLVALVVVIMAASADRSPNWIEAVVAGVPALLSGTFLVFYKVENDALRKVEHDVRLVHQVRHLLELANSIEDEAIRASMYRKIVKLIEPVS